MEAGKFLHDFFIGIATDPRIGSTHIALFSAILYLYEQQGFQNPVRCFRTDLMPPAKILAQATFHKTIKELSDYGYLKYESSFNRSASKIYLHK